MGKTRGLFKIIGDTKGTFHGKMGTIKDKIGKDITETEQIKGLDLIECLINYGWKFVTLYRRQESRHSPRKRNAKKQNGSEKKRSKTAKEKRKDIPF